MKKSFLFYVVMFFSLNSFAKMNDVLTLNNEMMFKGTVTKINKCSIKFKTEVGKFEIPAEDICFIQFEDSNNKLLKEYQELNDADKCFKGQSDAANYHGKAAGHVILGVLTGPFGIIGAAVANPTPEKGKKTLMMSENKELFSDSAYLMCYKQKAKLRNVGNTAIGWGAWILIVLLAA
jgi:hypothetical protein